MTLLDLFCGAGGAAMGYHRAGFNVTGVDILPQKRYPFSFVQADALAYLAQHGQEYDVIHASPPCQAYSALKRFATRAHPALVEETRVALQSNGRPWVIENVVGAPLRWPLLLCGSMFGLQTPCGAQLRRHRLFESPVLLMSPGACQHGARTCSVAGHAFQDEAMRWQKRQTIMVVGATPRDPGQEKRHWTISVCGETPHDPRRWRAQQRGMKADGTTLRATFSVADARVAMGIDWMGMKDLSQAIPPIYTTWIGQQLCRYL